jgi:molybdate transport system substrate-binding protein
MTSHWHLTWRAYPCAIAACFGLMLLPAPAAELQVFGVAPVRTTVTALSAAYQQSSGKDVKPTIVASDIVEKSLAGKTFDVMVLSTPEMDEQQKLGRIQGASRVKLARVGIGVAMRDGATKPDLSTPEKFKSAMLAAKSIAYRRIDESYLSGALAERILASAGILDTVRPKIKIMNLSASKAAIASGEIEFGFYNISEATGPAGVVLAGPVPEPLQLYSSFEAALTTNVAALEEAKGFLTFIAGSSAKPVWDKAGFEPAR